MNAILYGSDSWQPDFYHYANAYIDAYIILNNNLKERHARDCDYYPLLYIYAHILELTFKNILNISQIIFPNNKSIKTHNLKKLWVSDVKIVLSKLPNRFKTEEIVAIEELINEINEIRKYQEVFRYPDSSPINTINVSSLIKKNDLLKHLRNINCRFLEIEYLFRDVKALGLEVEELIEIEEVANSHLTIELVGLENRFKDKACLALAILKSHYTNLTFGQSCQLKPHKIDLSKIQRVINITFKIQDVYKHISNEFSDNYTASVSVEEIQRQIEDKELKRLFHLLEYELSSLSIEELRDLESLMDIGRNNTILFNYLTQRILPSDRSKEEIIMRLLNKGSLGNFLMKGLSFLCSI